MTNFKARKTTYNGIEMRSRLEAGFAQWLDSWSLSWHYEPQAFGSQTGQYLPDFLVDDFVVDGGEQPVFVEVKPDNFHETELLIQQAAVMWNSTDVWSLLLVRPGLAPMLLPNQRKFVDSGWFDCVWTYEHFTSGKGTTQRCGLRLAMEREHQPWPDNWWQVKS